MRSKRVLKKLHKRWLNHVLYDVSVNGDWRKKLFNAPRGEIFGVDESCLEGLDETTRAAILEYDLRYNFGVIKPLDCDAWFSEGGLVVFKFWARDFPGVSAFSGNDRNCVY
jgi:hypothetical protein